ncbi:Uncharacterised protein [Yersinia enterocolitica]|nr:hypothetical protein [Yersinia enterocolitica]EKN4936654.1 hypothetical protein [Yersinia enterocolitica]EKN5021037.1 hypothetical protein [Yersinia enterocolitica]EKN5028287.1 hypothetical protein [Yersinia enterocolitica]EKN5049947.1 hypothetical protein [Yersinia enterocolitica]
MLSKCSLHGNSLFDRVRRVDKQDGYYDPNGMFPRRFTFGLSALIKQYNQLTSSAQAVWTRPAHSQRSVHVVRDGGEHCSRSKWQVR